MTVGDELDRTWRDQWGRLLALLVAQYRRLDLAEDALADAFEAATRRWPVDGVPTNQPAWLLTSARRRVVDRLRAEAVAARKHPLLVVDAELQQQAQRVTADAGEPAYDERLRLILLCAHPSLAPEAASALSLRLVLGIPVADIARLFLVTEPTMAARLTRAKKKLVTAGVPLRVPEGERLERRVAVFASVSYLAFTAGYAPGTGPDLLRSDVAGEAIRLVRLGLDALPGHEMLTNLLALMLLQHSRRDARTGADGGLVLLPDQDRSRWRGDEIDEALGLLSRSEATHATALEYRLQALIATEHAAAATADDTRWDRIAARYAELEALTGSPVVRLNRAVAVAEAFGPEAGLDLLEGLDDAIPRHHRLPAARAELLARAGDLPRAREWYDAAIGLCGNEAERSHLEARRAEISD